MNLKKNPIQIKLMCSEVDLPTTTKAKSKLQFFLTLNMNIRTTFLYVILKLVLTFLIYVNRKNKTQPGCMNIQFFHSKSGGVYGKQYGFTSRRYEFFTEANRNFYRAASGI